MLIRLLGLAIAALLFAAVIIEQPERADATPIYSVRSAARCDTCHVEPSGWLDPPEIADRLCTLDCQGCHYSSSGGGGRTPTGQFYGRHALPTFGERPSSKAPGTGSGRYRLWEGFSGWGRTGTTPMNDIKDRFGSIDPEPTIDFGADVRALGIFPNDGDSSIFPMQAEVYGNARVDEHVSIYAAGGLQGRRQRTFDDLGGVEEDEIIDYFTVREAFVNYDRLPYRGYVRAGRFNKNFGWRIPDHTAFQRDALELDQYAQVFGVEAGINPNYPYANVQLFAQGLDSWPGDQQPGGFGATANFGVRELGWQLGLSVEALQVTELDEFRFTSGPSWALNLFPVVYLGEVDVRATREDSTRVSFFSYHEVNALIVLGLNAGARYEWLDIDISTQDDHRHRFTTSLEWNVYSGTQVAANYRWNFDSDFSATQRDLLVWVHWFL